MPFINADRIKETTTTTGTGPLTLAGAVVGFRSFLLAPMATNDTCSYAIVSATGLESEAGIGTFTSPNILTRTTVQSSSNGNAAVNFSAGVKDVFIGPIAGTQVPYDPVTGTLGLGVNALNDVAITSPTVNQVLKYSGTEWTNQPDSVNVGTVTIVSVVSANGFGGTVATDTTTPAITLTTSITGLLKGNASALLAAVAGTDYVTPTGSAAGLTSFPTLNQNTTGNAATVTTNANLTGHITSVGNTAALGSFTSAQLYTAVTDKTGTGGAAVFAISPTLVTPLSNTLSAIPIVSGLTASVTAASSSGGILTYTATNTFTVGRTVSVTGLGITSGTTLNIAGMTIATASPSQFTVVNATVGVSSGTGTATAGGNTLADAASNAVTAGPGGNRTLKAGDGAGVGKGGDVILQAGLQATSGGDGKVIVRQVSGQTSNLQEWQTSASGGTLKTFINNGGLAYLPSGSLFYNQLTLASNGLYKGILVEDIAADGRIKLRHSDSGSAIEFWHGNTPIQLVSCVGNNMYLAGLTRIGTSGDAGGSQATLTYSDGITPQGRSYFYGRTYSSSTNHPIVNYSYNGYEFNTSVNASWNGGQTGGGYGSLSFGAIGHAWYFAAALSSVKPLIVKGAASQTANLQEWQDSAGTALAYVDAAGKPFANALSAVPVASGAGNSVTIAAGPGVGTGAGGSLILQAGIQATSGGDGKVIVRQVSGQTSNLQEWQTSASGGTLKTFINNGGLAYLPSGSLFYNQLTLASNGLYKGILVEDIAADGRIKLRHSDSGSAIEFWHGNTPIQLVSCVGNNMYLAGLTRIGTSGDAGGSQATLTYSDGITPQGRSYFYGRTYSSSTNHPIVNYSYNGYEFNTSVNASWNGGQTGGGYGSLSFGAIGHAWYFAAALSSVKPLIVKGAASQTANLQEWQNSAGTVQASVSAGGVVKTIVLTVATLPAAATAGAGARAFVSDATLTTFATVPIGGGANGVPVYSDGANWYIG